MKLNKRWFVIMIVIGLTSSFLFAQTASVRATFNDLHATMVLLRFDTEALQKTPAGQYFESLYWKHNDELIDIARKYPRHAVEFSDATLKFVPELEAFLDGKGDKAYITYDHMQSLKAELDWFISVSSPALRDDIQRELQRFPLDQFVGMTMSEAYDLVNTSWSSDDAIEKSIVPGSNGEWAFYVHNDVYFEYPASYNLQVSSSKDNYIYLIPTTDVPEYWNPCVVKLRILYIPIEKIDEQNPRTWYSSENVLWERSIELSEFPGIAFATINPDYPLSNLQSFQFNEASQRGVHISTMVYGDARLTGSLDYSEIENHRFEYFQHMVASLRVQQP